jgi:hypothetical protein
MGAQPEFEVLRAVVELVAIPMVRNLAREQGPTEDFGHDLPMLGHIALLRSVRMLGIPEVAIALEHIRLPSHAIASDRLAERALLVPAIGADALVMRTAEAARGDGRGASFDGALPILARSAILVVVTAAEPSLAGLAFTAFD